MKILHFAPENFAGLPAALVRAERALGHQSFLMTLYKNPRGLTGEDFCLNVPHVATAFVSALRRRLAADSTVLSNRRRLASEGVPVWRPANLLVRMLFDLRDLSWRKRIRKALQNIAIDSFETIVLDGGVGFLRNGEIVKALHAKGKKIITCYYGSDLRTRGILPQIEKLAAGRFTFEFDHTLLYPELTFLFFPFEHGMIKAARKHPAGRVRVGHAPTNRAAKGTAEIIAALQHLRGKYPLEIVLIENLPYEDALKEKAKCDVFVDTIGELGYGINSLEALTMGLPTAVQLLPDFERFLGDHPFINVSAETLVERLAPLLASKRRRAAYAHRGRAWVAEKHAPIRVADRLWGSLSL
jgi:hypothetical protein